MPHFWFFKNVYICVCIDQRNVAWTANFSVENFPNCAFKYLYRFFFKIGKLHAQFLPSLSTHPSLTNCPITVTMYIRQLIYACNKWDEFITDKSSEEGRI